MSLYELHVRHTLTSHTPSRTWTWRLPLEPPWRRMHKKVPVTVGKRQETIRTSRLFCATLQTANCMSSSFDRSDRSDNYVGTRPAIGNYSSQPAKYIGLSIQCQMEQEMANTSWVSYDMLLLGDSRQCLLQL
ncbi:hypothetical protein IG631_08572 [Alternaria alternata]|nr:hypothetical protein IG631_08572 [Alternaria alternata]